MIIGKKANTLMVNSTVPDPYLPEWHRAFKGEFEIGLPLEARSRITTVLLNGWNVTTSDNVKANGSITDPIRCFNKPWNTSAVSWCELMASESNPLRVNLEDSMETREQMVVWTDVWTDPTLVFSEAGDLLHTNAAALRFFRFRTGRSCRRLEPHSNTP